VTELRFTPAFKSYELQNLDVPVEVYSQDMKVVARTTSSQPLTVEPGQMYYAVARLPAGGELFGSIEAQGDSATVALEPEPGEEPEESHETTHYLTSVQETAAAPAVDELESLGAAPPAPAEVTARRLTGNPFAGPLEIADEVVVQPAEGETFDVYPGPGTVLVQVLQPGFAPITLAAPAAPGPPTRLKWVRHPAGHWTLDVHLAHPVANLLVHYRAQGFARQAAETLESPNLDAEELLRGKMADPIGAAVGAYALLRFTDLERLHDWTANLHAFFPDFPDAAAIRGEHLARLGKHEEAAEIFVGLKERGLPAFSDGVSYSLDRLRLYLESGEFPEPKRRLCADVLELLKRLAPIVDFGKPVLTFTADPLELLRPGSA
jgi:hypothetical protein